MIIRFLLTVFFSGTSFIPAFAQQAGSSADAAETLAQCAQVQPVIQRLLDGASARLEAARQSNSAEALRAAVADVDGALRDVRAQLAPCANVPPAGDAHAGHAMPNVQQAPAAAPGTPAMAPGSTSPAPAAVAPGAKAPASAVDPHAGHGLQAAPAKPTPAVKPAPGAKPRAGTKPPAAPPMDHSKMNMGTATKAATGAKTALGKGAPATPPSVDHSKMDMGTAAKPAPRTKPAPGAKPEAPAATLDHSKMSMGTPDTAAQATDPVCGLKVDPATAPQSKHGGQTYYFCSDQHRELFQKTPAKYLPKGQ